METKFKIPTGRAKTNPGVDGQHLFGVVCGAEGGKEMGCRFGKSVDAAGFRLGRTRSGLGKFQ